MLAHSKHKAQSSHDAQTQHRSSLFPAGRHHGSDLGSSRSRFTLSFAPSVRLTGLPRASYWDGEALPLIFGAGGFDEAENVRRLDSDGDTGQLTSLQRSSPQFQTATTLGVSSKPIPTPTLESIRHSQYTMPQATVGSAEALRKVAGSPRPQLEESDGCRMTGDTPGRT